MKAIVGENCIFNNLSFDSKLKEVADPPEQIIVKFIFARNTFVIDSEISA